MEFGLILPLAGLIALAVLALAWMRLRADGPDKPRGSTRAEGYHTLTSDYQSGLGGHSTSWRVPADPDAYARSFVPRQAREQARQNTGQAPKGHQKEISK